MSLPNDSLENSNSTAASVQKSGASSSSKQLLLNLFTAAILIAVVFGGFSKTVFQGAPISRLYQLGQRDTLFGKYFTPIREGYDASVYQYFIPCHHFLVKNLRQGIVPLWNPLVGCGEPFLADIETATFWPLRAALIWMEPLRSWNLLIVLNLLVFALGTFLVGIMSGLRRFAAVFAALICAFCPFLIFHSELIGSSSSWIPLVLASFIWVERKRTLLSKGLAGGACALMIVSGHPEPSFFGIVTSSLAYLLFRLFTSENVSSTENARTQPIQPTTNAALFQSKLKKFALGLVDIAQIGLFAFAFSAPLLIPFAELLKSSDCYKLGLTGHRPGVPLNSILINFVHPAYSKCSPFLGVLAIPLCVTAVVGAFKRSHYLASFVVSSVLLICMMSQIGPLDFVMNLPSFSWFVPKYCFPALLVLACLTAGFGMQEITDRINTNWKQVCLCIVGASIVVLASLIAIKFAPALLECIRQDEGFDKMAVISNQWTRDIILLTMFSIITVATRFLPSARSAVMVIAIGVCTALSMAPTAKNASPVNAGLHYDEVAPIPFLQKAKERIVTMGRHTFCPSSNFVYDINNIVPVNVYHPSGFLTYLQSCGITPEGVNQFFDNDLTPAINLSATKYVVSPYPVLSSKLELPPPSTIPAEAGAKWEGDPDISLEAASLAPDPANRQLLGILRFRTSATRAKKVGLQVLLRDQKGQAVWFSDTDRILYLFAKNDPDKIDSFDYKLKVAIPKYPEKLTLAIQLFDWDELRFLPFAVGQAETPGIIQLAEIDPNGNTTSNIIKTIQATSEKSAQFRLVDEAANRVRVYENTKALPFCYLTKDLSKETSEAAPQATEQSVSWTRPDCNTIRAEVNAPEPMHLVVAEFFEPHWKAEVVQNGARTEEKMVRANKYFQAIPVPKGSSIVTLRYEPVSYKIGIGIFAIGLCVLAFLTWQRERQ